MLEGLDILDALGILGGLDILGAIMHYALYIIHCALCILHYALFLPIPNILCTFAPYFVILQ